MPTLVPSFHGGHMITLDQALGSTGLGISILHMPTLAHWAYFVVWRQTSS